MVLGVSNEGEKVPNSAHISKMIFSLVKDDSGQ